MKESASLSGEGAVRRSAVAAPTRRKIPKLNGRLYVGLTIVAIMGLGSLILPFFSPTDPAAQGTYLKSLQGSAKHFLGANALGQDVFWYLVVAIRNSLLIGVTVSVAITAIATTLGLSAGYIGGWYERIVVIFIDTFIT